MIFFWSNFENWGCVAACYFRDFSHDANLSQRHILSHFWCNKLIVFSGEFCRQAESFFIRNYKIFSSTSEGTSEKFIVFPWLENSWLEICFNTSNEGEKMSHALHHWLPISFRCFLIELNSVSFLSKQFSFVKSRLQLIKQLKNRQCRRIC